jgi:hypothetical protein
MPYVNHHQSHVNVRWDNFEMEGISEGDICESVVIFNVLWQGSEGDICESVYKFLNLIV